MRPAQVPNGCAGGLTGVGGTMGTGSGGFGSGSVVGRWGPNVIGSGNGASAWEAAAKAPSKRMPVVMRAIVVFMAIVGKEVVVEYKLVAV